MVGMIDPLRATAGAAVAQCLSGGISVVMITGDHPRTARAIAMQLGLCSAEDPVVTGDMIRAAAEGGDITAAGEQPLLVNSPRQAFPEALVALIAQARVFARIEPQQKELIVKVFMSTGHFVAVTGDGVNDAPAMRAANVAGAMGKRGTDVARETADLIITDDNFASIVAGIREGRVVYNNIRKVIGLLVATGFSIILLFFLCVFAGLPMPMLAVQLLWLNLVANGLQDVALAFEPSEGHEIQQTPRAPKEPVFDGAMIEHVFVAGSLMGFVAFACVFLSVEAGLSDDKVRNLTLMLMVIFGNIHALNSRSEWQSIFKIPLKRNLFLLLAVPAAQMIHIAAMYVPGLKDVLGLSPITFLEWGQLLLGASSLLIVEEVHKYTIRARKRRSC
jgi:magnesium-transporting ATPase (P-type)